MMTDSGQDNQVFTSDLGTSPPSQWQIGLSVISSQEESEPRPDPFICDGDMILPPVTPGKQNNSSNNNNKRTSLCHSDTITNCVNHIPSRINSIHYPGRFTSPECVHLFIADDMRLLDDTSEMNNTSVVMVSKSSSTDSETGLEPGCSTHLLERDDSHQKFLPSPLSQDEGLSMSDSFSRHPLRSHVTGRRYQCYPSACFVRWNWPAIRLGCFLTLLSSMVATTCVIVGLLVAGPTDCDPPREWWQGAVFYEVFTASFQDTDGDGFGDFQGVLHRIDYVQRLNVAAVRFNSIFSALDYPFQYEHVIDFKNVDPHLGKMTDFEELVKELHRRNIRVVLDINPTVTSDAHHWAANWLLNKTGDYKDFYVSDADKEEEEYEDTDSNLVETHLRFGGQLFLNWSNPKVEAEMTEVFEFWLNKGVDGFYLKHLEDIHVANDQELHSLFVRWRQLLQKVTPESQHQSSSPPKIFICSEDFVQWAKSRSTAYADSFTDMINLIDVRFKVSVQDNIQEIRTQLKDVADFRIKKSTSPWILWKVGDARSIRFADQIESEYNMAVLFLLMVLPGSVSLFYGDEIGLKSVIDLTSHKLYRSGQLCPMPWSSSLQANFTNSSTPWLPVHPDFVTVNTVNNSDTISLVRRLVALRNKATPLAMNAVYDDNSAIGAKSVKERKTNFNVVYLDASVLAIERFYPKKTRLLMCANFGNTTTVTDLSKLYYESKILISNRDKSGWINMKQFALEPGEAFIGEAYL